MHLHSNINRVILLVVTLLCFYKPSHAQAPVFEITCAPGQQYDRQIGVTYDNLTGKYRQWLCYDNAGNAYITTPSIAAALVGCTINNGIFSCSQGFLAQGVYGFQTSNPNGGFQSALGNGSQVSCTVSNACQYGDSTYNGWHYVIGGIDAGISMSSGPLIPSRDLSVGMTLSAMGAQSTATLTPITNMIWNISSSKNYSGWCEIPITFAASATVAFGLVGPGTPTTYNLDAYGTIGAAAVFDDVNLVGQTTWVTTKTSASGAPGTSVTEIVHVNFQIQNGTSSGNLTLDTSANGTNNITIGANAVCHVMQLN